MEFFCTSSAQARQESGLVGYRQWREASPRLRVAVDEMDTRVLTAEVTLYLTCAKAESFKIASEPEFEGASWRDMVSSVEWTLEGHGVNTIYVLFRWVNPKTSFMELASVVHYTLDRRWPEKKIQKTPYGTINWTDGLISNTARSLAKASHKWGRYDFSKAQATGEEESLIHLINTFKRMDLDTFYRVEDRLQTKGVSLGTVIERLRDGSAMTEIAYESGQTVVVTRAFAFWGPWLFALKPQSSESIQPDSSLTATYETVVESVVIDVRGHAFFTVFVSDVGVQARRDDASSERPPCPRQALCALSEKSASFRALWEGEGEGKKKCR